MTLSGIDTGIFSAHSTRGAAISKARAAGVSIPDILRAADWSSVSTFKRFYHRPVHSSEFGWVVLGSMQPIATQKSVSYKRYHVVNWLCCWKVSGTSGVQLQIPQGLLQSDEEDELYEEVEDTWRQHSQFPPLSSLPSPSFHRRPRLEKRNRTVTDYRYIAPNTYNMLYHITITECHQFACHYIIAIIKTHTQITSIIFIFSQYQKARYYCNPIYL